MDYAKATVVSVHEPAEGRIAALPVRRGGMRWMRMAAHRSSVQVELKREIVLDALRRIGRLASADVALGQTLTQTGYRTTFAWASATGGRLPRAPQSRPHRHRPMPRRDPLLADLIEDGRYGDARE